MQLSGGNSTCKVVKKIIRSLNRTNRPNRQTCKGSLSIMRCNFRMENPICQIEHNISHSSNRTKGNSSCRVVNKIVHSPNRTNRLNRQTWKGSLSIMRCNCGIENSTCRIVQKFLYSPNRWNWNSVFSDRIRLTVLDMDEFISFCVPRIQVRRSLLKWQGILHLSQSEAHTIKSPLPFRWTQKCANRRFRGLRNMAESRGTWTNIDFYFIF